MNQSIYLRRRALERKVPDAKRIALGRDFGVPLTHSFSLSADGRVVTFNYSGYRHRFGLSVAEIDTIDDTEQLEPNHWASLAVVGVNELVDTGHVMWAKRARMPTGYILLSEPQMSWPSRLEEELDSSGTCTLFLLSSGHRRIPLLRLNIGYAKGARTPLIRSDEPWDWRFAFGYVLCALYLAHLEAERGVPKVLVDLALPGSAILSPNVERFRGQNYVVLDDDFLHVNFTELATAIPREWSDRGGWPWRWAGWRLRSR